MGLHVTVSTVFKAIRSQDSWKLRGLSAMGKVVINRFLISELTALESNN